MHKPTTQLYIFDEANADTTRQVHQQYTEDYASIQSSDPMSYQPYETVVLLNKETNCRYIILPPNSLSRDHTAYKHYQDTIHNHIDKMMIQKDNVVLENNSTLVVPYNATVENVKLNNSQIRLSDAQTLPSITNSILRNTHVALTSTDFPTVIHKTSISNAKLHNVESLDDVSIINVKQVELRNTSLQDVDIMRTADQMKNYASLHVYDTDLVGFDHDMFDEDKKPMGAVLVSNGSIYTQQRYYDIVDARKESYLREYKENNKQGYYDMLKNRELNGDDGSSLYLITETTVPYLAQLDALDDVDLQKEKGHHEVPLEKGDIIVMVNNDLNANVGLTDLENQSTKPSNSDLIHVVTKHAENVYGLNTNHQNVLYTGSQVCVPIDTTVSNVTMNQSVAVLEKSSVNTPSYIRNTTLVNQTLNSHTSKNGQIYQIVNNTPIYEQNVEMDIDEPTIQSTNAVQPTSIDLTDDFI